MVRFFTLRAPNDRMFVCHPEEQRDEESQNIRKLYERFFAKVKSFGFYILAQNDRKIHFGSERQDVCMSS